MPELPEIETVKLQLQKVLVGSTIEKIEVINSKSVIGDSGVVSQNRIEGIRRKGKVLIIDLEHKLSLAIHFKMSGQLIYEQGGKRIAGGHPTKDFTGELPSKHTRVTFHISGGKLYFNDQRKFGWVKIDKTEEINKMKFLESLGPEIWEINKDDFEKRFLKIKRPIKLAIMDQEVLSGVGNIYANDACWVAKIDPLRGANTLKGQQYKDLYEAIKSALEEGIKYGGATAADAKYIDLHGLGGHYQEHFKVYDREGEKCLRPACRQTGGGIIKKVKMGGRGTYWCPKCQQ